MQILEEKLAVAGRDWDTMKESLKSRITILEGEPLVQFGGTVSHSINLYSPTQRKGLQEQR